MTITTDTTDTGTDACGPGGSCALVARTGARTGQPAMVVPGAMDALQALGGSIAATGIPPRTLALVNLRVSQINGCGTCLLGDLKAAREHGITDEELVTVAAWRETPFFTAADNVICHIENVDVNSMNVGRCKLILLLEFQYPFNRRLRMDLGVISFDNRLCDPFQIFL